VEAIASQPDFLVKGYIVNSERLAQHYDALKTVLPKRLQKHANIDEFLRSISEVVHNAEMMALPQNAGSRDTVAPPSKTRDTAQNVAKHAERLLTAMAELRRDALMDFDGQFAGVLHQRNRDEYLVRLNDTGTPQHEVSGDAFLAKLWHDLELLKETASKVADNVSVDQHNQPSKAHAKNIARGVAENWLRCFGEMPKADANDAGKTSFTKLLRELANVLRNDAIDHGLLSLYAEQFSIGASIASEAVEKMKGG
jgi:hypothetical protein